MLITPNGKVKFKLFMEVSAGDDLAFRLVKALVTRCGATVSKCRPRAFLELLVDKKPTTVKAVTSIVSVKALVKLPLITERVMPLNESGD